MELVQLWLVLRMRFLLLHLLSLHVMDWVGTNLFPAMHAPSQAKFQHKELIKEHIKMVEAPIHIDPHATRRKRTTLVSKVLHQKREEHQHKCRQ